MLLVLFFSFNIRVECIGLLLLLWRGRSTLVFPQRDQSIYVPCGFVVVFIIEKCVRVTFTMFDAPDFVDFGVRMPITGHIYVVIMEKISVNVSK